MADMVELEDRRSHSGDQQKSSTQHKIKSLPNDLDDITDLMALQATKKAAWAVGVFASIVIGFFAFFGYDIATEKEAIVRALDVRLTALGDRLDNEAIRFDSSVESLEERLRPISEEIASLRTESIELREQSLQAQRYIDDAKSQISDIDSRLGGIQAYTDLARDAQQTVFAFYKDIENGVESNRQQLAILQSNATALGEQVEKQAAAITDQFDLFAIALPTKRETRFANWPIRLDVGTAGNGLIESVRVLDEAGSELSRYADLIEGQQVSAADGRYRYLFHLTSIIKHGIAGRSVLVTGTRTRIVGDPS